MDSWYFNRTELATKYCQILELGISPNLAIAAPRRKGKTMFLLQDMCKIAKKFGYQPIYASLWQNINKPQEGIILALQEHLDNLNNKSKLTILTKNKIKKVAIGNESIGRLEIEMANAPQPATAQDLTLIDSLLTAIEKKSQQPILLLIDEIQHLATSEKFNPLAFGLRTIIDKRCGRVKSVMTGSSRNYMNLLFNKSQSPFYHFVEIVEFPDLGDNFLEFINSQLLQRNYQPFSLQTLQQTFKKIDHSPYWMMKVISHTLTYTSSLTNSATHVLAVMQAAENYEEIVQQLKDIDKIIFGVIAANGNPFSKNTLDTIATKCTVKGIAPNVQRSIQRLLNLQLISQIEQHRYHVEKPGLKTFIEHELLDTMP